jgi:hypothetical protein
MICATATLVPAKLVFDGKLPVYTFDNMEGIAAHRDERGTVITVISDDNFNKLGPVHGDVPVPAGPIAKTPSHLTVPVSKPSMLVAFFRAQ